MKEGRLNLADDLVDACAEAVGNRSAAVRAVRALCRSFGGQPIYIPARDGGGVSAEEIRGVLVESVGEHEARLMLSNIMALLGGVQVYVPKESRAFRECIAQEVFEKHDGSIGSMRELCREYSISFVQIYRLWREGRTIKNKEYHKEKEK